MAEPKPEGDSPGSAVAAASAATGRPAPVPPASRRDRNRRPDEQACWTNRPAGRTGRQAEQAGRTNRPAGRKMFAGSARGPGLEGRMPVETESDLVIFAGNSNKELVKEICDYLDMPIGRCEVGRFSDGEIQIEIAENVRGRDVFLVQSTSTPVNDHLMELLIMIDAARRASAASITAVVPYFGYARQDRKVAPRTPITARLVADLITSAGADRFVSMDLHAGQIQGFFDMPSDHLYASPVLVEDMKKKYGGRTDEVVVVSPDAGGVERARAFAKRLGTTLAIVDKRRPKANVAEVMQIIGDVKGKTALLLDDMIDTAGALPAGATAVGHAGRRPG